MARTEKWFFAPIIWLIWWAAYHDTLRELEEEGLLNRYAMPWDWLIFDPLAKWVCR